MLDSLYFGEVEGKTSEGIFYQVLTTREEKKWKKHYRLTRPCREIFFYSIKQRDVACNNVY